MLKLNHLLLTVALATSAVQVSGEYPLIYGFMATSDEWRDLQDQAYEQYAWYTFRADGSTPFTPISPVDRDQTWALYGGVYVDGVYYGYNVSGVYYNYTLNFKGISSIDWSTVVSSSVQYLSADPDSESSRAARLIPSDMAYNPLTKVTYAATRRYLSDSEATLCTVDLSNGRLTPVGSIPNLCALTCDPLGQLYGISIEDASLYKIANDGTATKVGETGFYPVRDSERTQSAAYDFASGKIYWSFYGFADSMDRNYNRNAVFGMLEVDPATGKAQQLCTYPRDQRFSSINILSAHPLAPADITDLTFIPTSTESNDGIVAFTVPTLTASSTTLTGDVDVTLNLDGELYEQGTAHAGDKYTKTITNLATGNHTVQVILTSQGNPGNAAYATAFFGRDVPAQVTSLTLRAGDTATKAVLTWNAPEKGENGSPLNAANVRYKVVRYPDQKTVAEALEATEWREDITSAYGQIYYMVTPFNASTPSQTGRAARSNTVMLGTDIPLPYTQTFDSQYSFNTFTTIDVDGDGTDEWDSPCWKYDPEYYCAFYCGIRDYPANDWLITPPLQLDENKVYCLSFNHYAYYGYGTSLRVSAGTAPTVEGMSHELADMHTVTTFYDKPGVNQQITFVPAPGERYIGFYHYSDNMEHLSIDDIEVIEVGDARAPGSVTNLKAEPIGNDAVKITFAAPTETAGGKALTGTMKVKISHTRTSAVLNEWKDIKPGESLEWTDNDAIRGVNSYYIITENSYGAGFDAEVSADTSLPLPAQLTGARTRYINDRQVEITWDACQTPDVRYQVYRIINDGSDYSYPMIGRDIKGLRMVDDAPATGYNATEQNLIQYRVAPAGGGGQAEAITTSAVYVGDAYKLPFAEDWAQMAEKTAPWVRNSYNGASWYVHGWAYDPPTTIPDGHGLLDCEANGDLGGYAFTYSPRIDLTSMTNPVLKFKIYQSPEYEENMRVMPGVQLEGEAEFTYTYDVFYAKADKAQWVECSVDLSQFANASRASIVLVGYAVPDQRLHLTDLRVEGDTERASVRSAYITGPAAIHTGDQATYNAYVSNNGSSPVSDVRVEIRDGSQTVATATIASIPANGKGSCQFEYTPQSDGVHTLTMVLPANDNSSTTKEVTVSDYVMGIVDDLSATANEETGKVKLQWSVASRTSESHEDIDSFELYPSFTISEFGQWTAYDGDGLVPFRLQSDGYLLEWPNCDKPQSFINFNPLQYDGTHIFDAYSGLCAPVSLGSPYGANDDWLISPELSGESQLISFVERALGSTDNEYFDVLISTTDMNPESFVCLNGNRPLQASADWTLRHFAVPAGTKWFAIRHAGVQGDGFVIDDVRFDGYFTTTAPTAYNVYRNDKLAATVTSTQRAYEFIEDDLSADVKYTVRAVYGDNEGDDSNAVILSMLGVGSVTGDYCAITANHGVITVTNATDAIEVYSIDGRKVAYAPAAARVELNVAPGIYIVRCGKRTAKVKA